MRNLTRTIVSSLLCLVMVVPLAAQGRQKPAKQKADPKAAVVVAGPVTKVIFHDSHRDAFRQYHRAHPIAVSDLPPGIRKKVARGKPLPPGIAKKQLAPGLVRIAPRLDPGYSYARVGRDVVVLNTAGLVADILLDAFR